MSQNKKVSLVFFTVPAVFSHMWNSPPYAAFLQAPESFVATNKVDQYFLSVYSDETLGTENQASEKIPRRICLEDFNYPARLSGLSEKTHWLMVS